MHWIFQVIHKSYCGYFGLVISLCPAWIILWHVVEKKNTAQWNSAPSVQAITYTHTHRYYMSQNSDHQYFVFFSSYLISLLFLILCLSFCCCQWKLGWKISWQRPVPPHHLLPFADSASSQKHLKHRDVFEPEPSAFHASLFRLFALLSQYLFAWRHTKTYLCWDFFWNLPIQPQQCPCFLFLLPLTLFICEYSELLLREWLVPGQTAFNSSHSLHLQSCLPAVQHMLCIPSPCLVRPPWQFNSSCTASCLESPVCSQVSAKMAAVIFT